MEAARRRKSVAAVVRERVTKKKPKVKKNVEKLMQEIKRVAKENAKYIKGKSLSELLIEMRYEQ